MALLRRRRYLSCFYCGKQMSMVYDGSVHQFACANCDATNYLDQNGDITDPPVSKTGAAETTSTFHDSFGSPGSTSSAGYGSPGVAPVFCRTCLKNQHLFISSLAQYFPSDPNDPDTPELERKYFKFRQGLEQRYPQVCSDCEPRVLQRIREAGYTAKTDHLRRMVEYSYQVQLTRATPVDAASWLGRKLWWISLLLQLLWQAGVVGSYLRQPVPSQSPDDMGFESDVIVDDSTVAAAHQGPAQTSAVAVLAVMLQPVLRLVVSKAGLFRSLCITATLTGCWWNPFLVQTVRGFTKPLIGIPTWYAYQATIILVRLFLSRVAGKTRSDTADRSPAFARLPPTIAGIHAVAALFILYLYTVAPRVIRKDLRPLFAKLPDTPLTPQRDSSNKELFQQQSENRRRGLETMADVLDEISSTPHRQQHMPPSPLAHVGSDTDSWDGRRPAQTGFGRPQSQHTPSRISGYDESTGAWRASRESGFSSLNLGDYGPTTPALRSCLSRSQEQGYYDSTDADEMDWTPTQPSYQEAERSPHRAFNTYQPATTGAFSQTPVEAGQGPFWYKVPAAPTSIAQRLFNRPNAPRLVDKNALGDGGTSSTASFFSQNGSSPGRTINLGSQGQVGASSAVEFAQPSFFAEDLKQKSSKGGRGVHADDDPGSFLSDLFSQTFTLAGGGGLSNNNDDDGPNVYAVSGSPRAPGGAGARQHQRRASSHAKRQPRSAASSSAGSTLFLRRAATLLTTMASLVTVYFLREDLSEQASNENHGSSGSNNIFATASVFQHVQPYARLIHASAVGLCAALSISLTSESIQRWRRIPKLSRRQGRAPVAGSAAAVDLALGLASIAMAGWMAMQMWTTLQANSGNAEPLQWQTAPGAYEQHVAAYGWLDNGDQRQQPQPPQYGLLSPWQWWELASLHGIVLVHQTWNMLVQ